MSEFADFWAMGGYAPYVWSSFGLTFAVLVANVIVAIRAHRKMLRELRGRNSQ